MARLVRRVLSCSALLLWVAISVPSVMGESGQTLGPGTSDHVFAGTLEPCDGTIEAGGCWFFGQNNQSCDEVCALHGGYESVTARYVGSGGSNEACGGVLSLLESFNPLPVTTVSTLGGISGLGCGSDYTSEATSYRLTTTTTGNASSASNASLYFRRVCGCGSQPAPASISYPGAPFELPRGVAMSPAVPNVSGFVAEFISAPDLPDGLVLNPDSGVITGAPTTVQSSQDYDIAAVNSGGFASTTIAVRVLPQAPENLTYPGNPFVFNQNIAISPVAPSVTGQVDSYEVTPDLPTGLLLDPQTGVLSGTPTAISSSNYLVSATNIDGSTNTAINITVQAPIVCDGVVVGGACWYFGANNLSCDEVCAGNGGYNAATASFAGSSGSNANCAQVLTALSAFNPTPVTDIASLGGISGMGCGSDYTNEATSYRLTSATTSSASSASNGSLYFRRACACND
jgi:hypothetical protein